MESCISKGGDEEDISKDISKVSEANEHGSEVELMKEKLSVLQTIVDVSRAIVYSLMVLYR